jgi:hypothetical protein
MNMARRYSGPQHIAGELFKFMAGVDPMHISPRARRRRSPISSRARCK